MKNLEEVIEDKVTNYGYTKTQIYNELNRSNSSFGYALKKMSFSIEELDKILKILNVEPNYFFEWGENSTQIPEPSPKKQKTISSKDANSEIEFLRTLVEKQAEIIKELSKTKN